MTANNNQVCFKALELAISIKAGSVWVNCHNMFDAAAGFGGYRESGFGRDGGKEGLFEYVRPKWEERPRPQCEEVCECCYKFVRDYLLIDRN